jgi:Cu+-exporting ATPase
MHEKIALDVQGMTCSSCAQGISKHLKQIGVKSVNVSFEEGIVEVDPGDNIPVTKLISEINSLGYKVVNKENGDVKDPVEILKKRLLICLTLTFPLFIPMIFHLEFLHNPILQLILCTPVVVIGLLHFGKSAWGSLKHMQPNMDVLITTGSLSAYIYSIAGIVLHSGVHNFIFFETSAAIITFLLLGNYIEIKTLKKTTSAVSELLLLQPLTAKRIKNALTDNELYEDIDSDKVKPNDLLLINTGDKVPADGIIYWGNASFDESAMTGEY